jgi:hypothetical protein
VLCLYLAERISWFLTVPFDCFSIVKSIDNIRYIEIPVGVDKNHQGGISHTPTFHYLKQNKENPDCCPLKLLEIYRSIAQI